MWFIDQKDILFRCRTDIRDEVVRPDLAYFSNALKDTNLKLLPKIVTGL